MRVTFPQCLGQSKLYESAKGRSRHHEILEMRFGNLLLGANYELKNRYMHIDYTDGSASQSAIPKAPQGQFGTLKCSLEELAVLELITKNPAIKQAELAEQTGKSVRSIKRIIDSLKEKQYIRRVDGERYGKWDAQV